MDEKTDEELIAEYNRTQELVLCDELIRRHAGRVRAMVYTMVLNDADAEDLTQDIFLRAIRNLSRFRNRAKFSTWLYRIMINTTRTFLSRRGRAVFVAEDRAPDAVAAEREPGDILSGRERERQIRQALAALSPPLRMAITLTAIEGMSPAAAAKICRCPAATLYWRVHEARRQLKQKLEP